MGKKLINVEILVCVSVIQSFVLLNAFLCIMSGRVICVLVCVTSGMCVLEHMLKSHRLQVLPMPSTWSEPGYLC